MLATALQSTTQDRGEELEVLAVRTFSASEEAKPPFSLPGLAKDEAKW